jgi:hypothetical protein
MFVALPPRIIPFPPPFPCIFTFPAEAAKTEGVDAEELAIGLTLPAVTFNAVFAVVAPLAVRVSATFVPDVAFVFVTLIDAPVTVCAVVPFAPLMAMFSPFSVDDAAAVEVLAILTTLPK